MNRSILTRATCVLLGVMLLASLAPAAVELKVAAVGEDAAAQPKKEASELTTKPTHKLRGEWGIMASQLKLSDEQTARIQDITQGHEKAMGELNAANKAKRQDLEKSLAAAREAKDEAALKKLEEQAVALKAEMFQLRAKQQAEVMAVLTSQQRIDWEAFRFSRYVRMRLHKIELTEDQDKKIDELAKGPGKQVAEMKESDEKAVSELRQKLLKDVTENVLTEEQRKKLDSDEPKADPQTRPAPKTAPDANRK